MAAPLVSVIIRSTARATLTAALDCIAAQTYPCAEAVVVAASGATHPSLPLFAGPHPVRLVPSAVALSRPLAGNAGIDAARGDWITFLDDDDAIDATHLAGLMEVALRTDTKVVSALARVRQSDGSERPWGQPFAPSELYMRNFLHLSTVLFSRAMLDAGCRFDAGFDIMEDWDLFLQMAQHARFRSTGLRTFEWHADAGESGAGGGGNQDDKRFAHYRDRIYAKWRAQRDALVARLEPALEAAGAAVAAADWPRAETLCDAVLAIAQNEPHALSMLARVMQHTGRVTDAIALQSLAATVRPREPAFTFNLALLVFDRGERDRARRLAEHALRLAPGYAPAAKFIAELDAR